MSNKLTESSTQVSLKLVFLKIEDSFYFDLMNSILWKKLYKEPSKRNHVIYKYKGSILGDQ
uniref:Uncharacterized protein n=1 Tax=Setaria italica TaxID=4555 RepID=K3YBJ1_SETIT